MAVKTVTGKLTDLSGNAIPYPRVRATLSAPAVIAATQEVAPTTLKVIGAADGTWTMLAQANADLIPANTSYNWEVGEAWSGSVIVPQTAGPFKIEDIMAPPSPLGAAWDATLMHLAGSETVTGVKSVKVLDWGGGVYNVKSGLNPAGAAKGDGVTDDTASFNGTSPAGLLATLKGAGGATQLLGAKGEIPPGAYSVGALALQSAHGVWLEGLGGQGNNFRSVVLQYNGSTGGVFLTLDQVRDCIFKHFTLVNGANTFAVGIDLDQSNATPAVNTDNDEFEDIGIIGFSTAGVRVGNSQLGSSCDLMTFRRINVLPATAGVGDGYLFKWGSSTLHRFYDCSAANCAIGFHSALGRGSQMADLRAWGTDFANNTVDVQTEATLCQSPIVFDGFYSENSTRLFVSGASGGRPSTVVFENGRWASDSLNADGTCINYQQRGVLNLRNVDFTTNANGGLTTVAGFQILCQNSTSNGSAVMVEGCTFPNMAPFPLAGGFQSAVGLMVGCLGYGGSTFDHIPPVIGSVGGNSGHTVPKNFGLATPLALTQLTAPGVGTNLGANVTSVTPTGNDQGGYLAIVMAGALAANTRIATLTFGRTYGGSVPRVVVLVNQTSGAGLAIVNFYATPSTGVSFDLFSNQALAAGTYTVAYLVFAQALT